MCLAPCPRRRYRDATGRRASKPPHTRRHTRGGACENRARVSRTREQPQWRAAKPRVAFERVTNEETKRGGVANVARYTRVTRGLRAQKPRERLLDGREMSHGDALSSNRHARQTPPAGRSAAFIRRAPTRRVCTYTSERGRLHSTTERDNIGLRGP